MTCSRPLHFNDPALISADLRAIDKKHSVDLMIVTYTLPQTIILHVFINCGLRRDVICFINKLTFKHMRCSDHLFTMNIVSSPLFMFGVLQSPDQILSACPNVATSIHHFPPPTLSICCLHDCSVIDIWRSYNLMA